MPKHLIVTEKNNTAKRIAEILSGGTYNRERIEGVDVYSFGDKIVMGLRGHILSVDFPKEYSRWEETNLRDLIFAEIVHVPVHRKYIKLLKKLSREVERITIATDYDREGELIGVEALRVISESRNLEDVRVDRVRYSTVTKEEILNAFSNPVEVDYNLAASAEVRQIVDLTWGATLTRFLSLSAGRVGKSFLSVGRVQSPTLALLVGREKEIQSFKPKKYFEVEVELENGVVARHAHGRFETYEEAQKILNSLDNIAKLLDLKSIVKNERPPIPFNTTEFLRAATSIGFSASNAMSIAENLYTNGYISYPRTDNTVYPASLNLKSVLKFLSKTEFREYVKPLLGDTLKPTRGKKETTDHPPIYPSSPASREELSEKEWKIYELVVRRFLATLYPPCVVESKQATFESGGEVLKAYGTTLINLGWRAVYTYSKISENPLPDMVVGDEFSILSSKIVEGETKPPPRFTQGSLIKLMEKLGIGTKSTRHEIIGKLYERAYVHGNPIKPTKLSFSVIETLEKYAPSITKPDMTRRLEEDMEKISRGDAIPDEVLDESRGMLSEILKTLSMEREGISEHLRNGVMEDSVVGICRECGSKLVIRKSKKGGRFIGCTGYPECTFSLPLPRSGRIYVLDKICEKHGIHHLRIYTKGRKAWDLGCPECGYEKWKSENC